MVDEKTDATESVSAPTWIDRESIINSARISIRAEYEQILEIWKNKELVELEKRNNDVIKEGLTKLFDKWKEEQKPPSEEDIQLLLNQDYLDFTITVQVYSDDASSESKVFTIRELPQAAEIKFYKNLKGKITVLFFSVGAALSSGL